MDQIVRSKPIHDKYQQVHLKNIWKSTLGKTIDQYTSDIRLYKGVLTVVVTSAPLRQELLYSKEKLRLLLNQALDGEIIKELKIF